MAPLSPPKQKPDIPTRAQLFVHSESSLRVMWMHPASDGGSVITKYKIEWDDVDTFDSNAGNTALGSYDVVLSAPGVDCVVRPCERVISPLSKGTPYHVRVYAYNAYGFSVHGSSTEPHDEAPKTQPAPPSRVTVTPRSGSATSLEVSFPHSEDNGGAAISEYRIECDVLGVEAQRNGVATSDILFSKVEVQSVTTTASAYDIGGQFLLSFEGHGTRLLDHDISAKDLEVALEELPTIGDVTVTRSDRNNGLEWLITFLTNAGDNQFTSHADYRTNRVGDVPPLLVSTDLLADTSAFSASSSGGGTLSGTDATVTSSTVVEGMLGYEQQTVWTQSSTGTISGTFQLEFEGHSTSDLDYDESAEGVKLALEILDGIGEVQVYRRSLDETTRQHEWTVLFLTLAGDVPLLGSKHEKLISSEGSEVVTVHHAETHKGRRPAMRSALKREFTVKPSLLAGGDVTYVIPELTAGTSYHVRVSAWNGVGNQYGRTMYSNPLSVVPSGVPSAPSNLNVQVLGSSSVLVEWSEADGAGAPIESYKVDYDTHAGVGEEQVLTTSASGKMAGSFALSFHGQRTVSIPWDASGDDVADALQLLPTIGHVSVSRGDLQRNGFSWTVTFKTNIGDVPDLIVHKANLIGASKSIAVREQRKGSLPPFDDGTVGVHVLPLGMRDMRSTPEVQEIRLVASTADVAGFFHVSFMGETTLPIAFDVSAEEMEALLMGMSTVDNVEVAFKATAETSEVPFAPFSHTWTVTFDSEQHKGALPMLLVSTTASSFIATTLATGGSLQGHSVYVSTTRLTKGGVPKDVIIDGLLGPADQYFFRISATNANGVSSHTYATFSTALVAMPPSAPLHVQAVALSHSDVLVTWSPPAHTGGEPLTKYVVQWDVDDHFRGIAPSTGSSRVAAQPLEETMRFVIPHLRDALRYKVRVIPVNSVGYGVPRNAVPAVNGFVEVQKVTFAAAGEDTETDVAGSTFTLSSGGEETSALPCDVGYLAMQDALQALPNVGQVHVNRHDYSDYVLSDTSTADILVEWLITFVHKKPSGAVGLNRRGFGNVDPLAVGTLTGAAVAGQFAVATVQDGTVEDLAEVAAQYLTLGDASPTPPTNVVLTVVSDAELGVSWGSPVQSGGQPVLQYLVEWDTEYTFDRPRARSPFHETVVFSATVDAATDPLQYLIQGLDPGVAYFARVSAWNGRSDAARLGYSTPMAAFPASATTAAQAPWKPVNVEMEVSRYNIADQVHLKWQPPVENLNRYASASAGRGSSQPLHSYRIEWDTSASFDRGAFGQALGSTDVGEPDVCQGGGTGVCLFSLGAEVQELRVYSTTHVELTAGEFRLQHPSFLTGPAEELCDACVTALSGNTITFGVAASATIAGSLGTNAVFSVSSSSSSSTCTFVVNGVDLAQHHIFVENGHGCIGFAGKEYALTMPPVSACIPVTSTAAELEAALTPAFGVGQVAVTRGHGDPSAAMDQDPGIGWFYRIAFVGKAVDGDQPNLRVVSMDATTTCEAPTSGANAQAQVTTPSNGGVLRQGTPYYVRVAGISAATSALYPMMAGAFQAATPYLESGTSLAKSYLVPRAEPLQPETAHAYADLLDDTQVWVTWNPVLDARGSKVLSYVVEYDLESIVDTVVPGIVLAVDTDANTVTVNCDDACLGQIVQGARFQVGEDECTLRVSADHSCTANTDCTIGVAPNHGCCPNTNWANACSWADGPAADMRFVTSTGLNYLDIDAASTEQYFADSHQYAALLGGLAPGREYQIRVRAANDQGQSHVVTYAEPKCQPNLEECLADLGVFAGSVLTRELPHAPTVVVPAIGGANGFTSTSLTVTFQDAAAWDAMRAIDKFKVEWDPVPSFKSQGRLGQPLSFDEAAGTSPEVIAANALDGTTLYTYTVVNLEPGLQYFLRVSGHHSLGYGAVSLVQVSIPRRSPDPVPDTIALRYVTSGTDYQYTSSLQLDWSRPRDHGGSPITTYLVEWGRAPWCVSEVGLQDNEGDCVTDRNMDRASFDISTVCDATCEVDGSFRVRLDTTACEACNVKSVEDSQNLRYDMSEAEMKTALENMPNVGVVIVTLTPVLVSRRTNTWNVEFVTEVGEVPAFQVLSTALLKDASGNDLTPTVAVTPVTTGTNPPVNDYCGGEACVVVDVEAGSDSSFSFNLAGSPSSPLLAGQKYYARVSAGNALGYGPRRNVPATTVPVSVPSSPTSYFHASGLPSLSVTGPQTLRVAFGPPTYDGGDSLAAYRVEWDTVPSFTGSAQGAPLGSHVIHVTDAELHICTQCATALANNRLSVTLTAAALRQLETGMRIAVSTYPDQGSSHCRFVVSDTKPSASAISVEDGHNCQDFDLGNANCGAKYTVPCVSAGYGITLLSAEYEISNLISGTPYFVRVFARNQEVGWGLPSNTSPKVLTPLEGATSAPSSSILTLSQGAKPGSSLLAQWPEQDNDAGAQYPVIGYAIERYVESSQAQTGTWAGIFGPVWSHVGGGQNFGVDEVQEIDLQGAQHGFFTVGYGDIDQRLPGTLACVSGDSKCVTSVDLTAHLMRGEAIKIGTTTYVVHATKPFTAQWLPLASAQSWPNLEDNDALGTVDTTFAGNTAAQLVAYKQATTPRLPPSISKTNLKLALENLPSVGAVKVERAGTFETSDDNEGYKWTVTFLTEVGDVPDLVVNGRLLSDGVEGYTEVNEILKGVPPNEYKRYEVPLGTNSVELAGLTTGLTYFVRIAAMTSSGLNTFTEATSAVPFKAPLPLKLVNLRPITDALLEVQFTDEMMDTGGSKLTHFAVEWDTNSNFMTADYARREVLVSNRIQKITTSAVTAPISGSFRLSVGEYHGDFTVQIGGPGVFANLRNGESVLTRSAGAAVLFEEIARGDFIRIVDQDFRICLNPHDGLYDETHLPLCTVENAFERSYFEFNCVLKNQGPCTLDGGVDNVPMWKLDTSLGAVFDIRLGDVFVKTEGNPAFQNLDSVGSLAHSDFPSQGLQVGDFIRIGHPSRGQVLRVQTGGTLSSQYVSLGSVSDSDNAASITSTALLSGGVTREVQMLRITSRDTQGTSDLESGTLRLGFGEEATACISYDVTEAEMKEALEALDAIQEVEVSKTIVATDGVIGNGFEYKITYVGNQNTGNQPPIMAIVRPDTVPSPGARGDGHRVQEDNSCDCDDFASSVATVDAVQIDLQTIEYAFAPVYKLQTTDDIPFDASSEDMKAALEKLSLVCTVDVSRSVYRHGFEWIVEFSASKEDEFLGGVLLPPLVPTYTALHAVQVPRVVVSNMYKVTLPAQKAGLLYYVKVSAANAAGEGASSVSSPSSVRPLNQLPGRPADVVLRTVSPTELLVEWGIPKLDGGLRIHSYKVEWDSDSAFSRCADCTEMVLATRLESIPDVQLVSTSVTPSVGGDRFIGGSFTLLFDGQKTRQIPWDASAEDMKDALEELCTVDTIRVSRHLGPMLKTTPGTPGANLWTGPALDRGYSWLVTFTKMGYLGSQFHAYNSELQYAVAHKLSVHASHLLSCDAADRSSCANDGAVSISTGTQQEEQRIWCDSATTSSFRLSFMGYSTGYIVSSGATAQHVMDDVKSALESLPSVGRVAVSTAQDTLCEPSPRGITITFETELGDLPPMTVTIGAV